MLNTKEHFNQLDATLALEELDDEVAATCSGGVAYLYQDDNFKGRKLTFYDGDNDLRKWNFNDKTSSIKIEGNELWGFYKDINFKPEPDFYLSNGSYKLSDLKALGIPNDSISSLHRVGST